MAITDESRTSAASRGDPKRSDTRKHPAILRYGIAVAVVPVAFAANEMIPKGAFPDPFFITAVMISAHFGGLGPALLSFLMSSLILDYFYVPPFRSLAIRPD